MSSSQITIVPSNNNPMGNVLENVFVRILVFLHIGWTRRPVMKRQEYHVLSKKQKSNQRINMTTSSHVMYINHLENQNKAWKIFHCRQRRRRHTFMEGFLQTLLSELLAHYQHIRFGKGKKNVVVFSAEMGIGGTVFGQKQHIVLSL